MTRSLAAVVQELAPHLFATGPPSVVRIQTTRAVYLLFGSDCRQPACVVRIAPGNEVQAIHRALTVLHRGVPDVVPAPLGSVAWDGDRYLHVQEGLPGLPWFVLPQTLRTEADWLRVEDRAQRALARLHREIAGQAEWRRLTRPGEEFRQQIDRFLAQDPGVSAAVVDALTQAARTLEALGEVDWFWQHGDFCLNNLLVARDTIGIIDFDEFGATSVPLQDEIGLGMSVAQLSAGEDDLAAIEKHVARCAQSGVERHREFSPFVRELFLHYLTYRVNRAAAVPQRQAARAKLIATLSAASLSKGSSLTART